MPPYEKLKALRVIQRKLLPAIRTATDLDIVLEVGCAQASNRTLGTTELFSTHLGAPATISRRLERLKRLRVIEHHAAANDKRRKYFLLSAPTRKQLNALLREARKILAD
jgi:hypothetical protein